MQLYLRNEIDGIYSSPTTPLSVDPTQGITTLLCGMNIRVTPIADFSSGVRMQLDPQPGPVHAVKLYAVDLDNISERGAAFIKENRMHYLAMGRWLLRAELGLELRLMPVIRFKYIPADRPVVLEVKSIVDAEGTSGSLFIGYCRETGAIESFSEKYMENQQITMEYVSSRWGTPTSWWAE